MSAYGGQALAALADPTRREIFEQIAARPCAVGELAVRFPVSRPAVSQHLRVLKDAGLVRDLAQGNRRIYRLEPRGLEELRTYLEGFWNEALISFQAAVEQQTEQEN